VHHPDAARALAKATAQMTSLTAHVIARMQVRAVRERESR
jgi:hypothetical protein